MKLGLGIGTLGPAGGARIIALAQEAERLGYDTIWCPEIYGADCFTPLAWVGAHTSRINLGTSIMQISARTPASAAMHAVALDHLSNGRLILGIGVSGPQVVEGWYGQPYPKPLARTREWVSIFRSIVARKAPVSFQGEHYQLPLQGGTGLGKPLKLMQHPLREHIPLYLGAEGPKNVAMAAEICDGWIPIDVLMDDLPPAIEDLKRKATAAGRNPATIPVNVFAFDIGDLEVLSRYRELGVERVVIYSPRRPERRGIAPWPSARRMATATPSPPWSLRPGRSDW